MKLNPSYDDGRPHEWRRPPHVDPFDVTLFDGPQVRIGCTRLPPDAPHWSRAAQIGDRPLAYFSRRPFLVRGPTGRRIVGDGNTAVLANAQQEFRREQPSAMGESGDWLSLDGAAWLQIASEIDPTVRDRPDRPVTTPMVLVDASTHLAQRALFRRVAGRMADAVEVEERAAAIIAGLLRSGLRRGRGAVTAPRVSARRRGTRRRHIETVNALRELLAARYAEALTLPRLARELHIAPFHLSRVFSRYVGIPIHAYLTRLRLRAALDECSADGANFLAAALRCGFCGASHFSVAFRREFGLSPRQAIRAQLDPRQLRIGVKDRQNSPR